MTFRSPNRFKGLLNAAIKGLGYCFLGLALAGFILSWVVQTPWAQRRLLRVAQHLASRSLGTPVEIGRIEVDFPGYLFLENIAVDDEYQQPLLRAEAIRLRLFSVNLWRLIARPKARKFISLRGATFIRLNMRIYKRTADGKLNIDFLLGESTKPERPPDSTFFFNLERMELRSSEVVYVDSTTNSWANQPYGKVNFDRLEAGAINGFFSLETAPLGRWTVGVYDLRLVEYCSGFELVNLDACLRLDTLGPGQGGPMRYAELSPFELKTSNTHIRGAVLFPGGTLKRLFDEQGDDQFIARLDLSRIHFSDVAFFTPEDLPVVGAIEVQGEVEGQFSRFSSRRFDLAFGLKSSLRTNFELSQLADIQKARLNVVVQDGLVLPRDLMALIPALDLPGGVAGMPQPVLVRGAYEGSYTDFQARASLMADAGALDASLHMTFPAKGPVGYDGNFSATALNLVALGISEGFVSKRLNARGKITGKGLSFRDLDARADVQIANSNLYGFEIDSVYGVVFARNKRFSASLAAKDSTGSGSLNMDMDLGVTPAKYVADFRTTGLNLQRYGLYPEPTTVGGRMRLDIAGDDLDDLRGVARISQLEFIQLPSQLRLRLPELVFTADHGAQDEKTYTFESSLVNVDVQGVFKVQKAAELVARLGTEAKLFLTNNDSAIRAYYAGKTIESTEFSIVAGISAQDSLSTFLDFFGILAYIPPGLEATARLDFDDFETANITMGWDTLAASGIGFGSGEIDFQLFKSAVSNDLLFTGSMTSRAASFSDKLSVQDLRIDIQGAQDYIETDVLTRQTGEQNVLQAKLITNFKPDGGIVAYLDSARTFVWFNGDTLRVNDGHRLAYDQPEARLDHLVVRSGNRFLRLDGYISEDPAKKLNVQLSQFDLSVLDEIADIGYPLSGRANANVDLYEVLSDVRLTGFCRIDGFEVNSFPYGNVFISTQWQQSEQEILLRANLVNKRDTVLALSGRYSFRDEISPVRFQVRSDRGFPLNYIEPFVEGQLYGIKGSVALDRFLITGTFDNLRISGAGELLNAGCGVAYLKTEYTINGLIQFDENRIVLPRITLSDREKHTAEFRGVIRHRGLREFVFDLQLDQLENFLLMDTKKGDNDLFYGTVYLKNGVGSLTGDLNRLNVQAFVTTGARTLFKIPLMEYVEDATVPEYISFKGSSSDKGRQVATEFAGFELNLTVLATEESRVELIFDDRVGDIIRGRGTGAINFNVTADGDFTMFGDYEIRDGDYLFTSQNVLNKKFLVRQGGRISWNGDPYDAQVRLDATYPVNADVKDLIRANESVRIPANVLMHMDGSLLQPSINLSIEIPNLDNQGAAQIVSALRSIQFDEQELNKQVFSLMVFNRFAPIGGGLGGESGAGVTTSISELLSNQLNYWLGQAIDDKVNVNVGTTNFQDVNLLVSAKLFNDRVTVERNGALVGQNTHFSIGNISIIIKLLPKPGQTTALAYPRDLVLEVFNRENLTDNLLRDNRTGLGVFYKIDFDNLYDLLRKAPRK